MKIYRADFSFPVRLCIKPVISNVICIKYACPRTHLYILCTWEVNSFFDSRCRILYFHINPLGKKMNHNYI